VYRCILLGSMSTGGREMPRL